MYALATRITFICPMRFNAFPMDIQVRMILNIYSFTLRVFQICKFKVGSFNYPMSKMTFLAEVMYWEYRPIGWKPGHLYLYLWIQSVFLVCYVLCLSFRTDQLCFDEHFHLLSSNKTRQSFILNPNPSLVCTWGHQHQVNPRLQDYVQRPWRHWHPLYGDRDELQCNGIWAGLDP